MSKQLVVIFTATGSQGYPIVEYLTTNAHAKSLYTVRALTRNPTSPTALALSALGAEVVACSLDSDESVTAAVKGANIIFANSDFWSVYTVEAEVVQGRRILTAAAALGDGLKHFVQSSFPDAKKISKGRYNGVLHYNAKNEIDAISSSEFPELWKKTTRVLIGYYYQNWLKFNGPFGPQKIRESGEEGVAFVQPMPYPPSTTISATWPGDLGVVFGAIVKGGEEFFGKRVVVVTDVMSDEERLRKWADALNVSAKFEQVTAEAYSARMAAGGAPPHIVQDLTEQLLMFGPGDYMSGGDMVQARDIVDKDYHWKTWDEYVREEDWSSIL